MKALSDSTCEDMLNDSGDRAELNRDLMRFLWRSPMRLFSLSRRLQKSCCGREVTYVINRNINFTNICVGRCRFCAFRKSDGYILTHEEIVQKAAEAEQLGATEICLQGGLAPGLTVEDYCEILEVLKSNFPGCTSTHTLPWR